MKRVQDQTVQKFMVVAKRVATTILICALVLAIVSYYLRNIITSNALQIVLFVVVLGLAVLIEEIVARKREKQKEQESLISTEKDIFK